MIDERAACGCFPGCVPKCNVRGCCPGGAGLRGPTGPTGPTGATGAPGAIASLLPFSVDSTTPDGDRIATDAEGNPSTINFVGFGGSTFYAVDLPPGSWEQGLIVFGESTQYGASFVMPNAGRLRSISFVFANRSPGGMFLPVGVVMRPFICIATMAANSSQLVYRIIPETMTFTEPYVGTDGLIPKYSLRWGTREGLNVPLVRGTAVAIVLGWMGDNVTEEQSTNASVSGSLYIE